MSFSTLHLKRWKNERISVKRQLMTNLPTCLGLTFAQVTKVTVDRGNLKSSLLTLGLMFWVFFLSQHASISKANYPPVDTTKKGFPPKIWYIPEETNLCSWRPQSCTL